MKSKKYFHIFFYPLQRFWRGSPHCTVAWQKHEQKMFEIHQKMCQGKGTQNVQGNKKCAKEAKNVQREQNMLLQVKMELIKTNSVLFVAHYGLVWPSVALCGLDISSIVAFYCLVICSMWAFVALYRLFSRSQVQNIWSCLHLTCDCSFSSLFRKKY